MKNKFNLQILLREYFEGIVAAVLLAFIFRYFVVTVLFVPSPNLEPNLLRGDFVLGWRIVYGLPIPLSQGRRIKQKLPQHGDLVSFRFPGDQEQILIRRIIAIGGEKVKIFNGNVILNGVPHGYVENNGTWTEKGASSSAYSILFDSETNMSEVVVPEGHVFVLCDNRSITDDSRSWGMVPMSHVESRLDYIWLSLNSGNDEMTLRWPRIFKKIH